MLKKILAILVMLYAAVAFAAVDVNKANAADLDSVKGIGPATSSKIIAEREKNGPFKDWNDLIGRVKGIGETNAATMSTSGLTVAGTSYSGAPAAPAAKKEDKPSAAKPAPAPATTPAKAAPTPATAPAPAPVADKKDPKAEAKAAKEAAKKAKAEEKQKKADKAGKGDAKADAAKPAASAAKK
jgi:competence protein ComEA